MSHGELSSPRGQRAKHFYATLLFKRSPRAISADMGCGVFCGRRGCRRLAPHTGCLQIGGLLQTHQGSKKIYTSKHARRWRHKIRAHTQKTSAIFERCVRASEKAFFPQASSLPKSTKNVTVFSTAHAKHTDERMNQLLVKHINSPKSQHVKVSKLARKGVIK